MKKRKFKILTICLLIIVLTFIIIWQLFNYLSYVKSQKYLYNEYNRTSIVLSLTYYKNLNSFTNSVLYQQRYTNEERITKEKLITDFANYEYIPILNYIKNDNELNSNMILAFSKIMDFIEFVNYYNYIPAESIMKNNSKGFYSENNIITVNKKVITKECFNKLFLEFINYKDLDTILLEKLYNIDKINKNYSLNTLKDMFNNDYVNFYNKFSVNIKDIVSNILSEFGYYLNSKCSIEPKEKNSEDDVGYKYVINLNLDYVNITLPYEFSVVQKIYNDNSKYSNELYSVNLEKIWNILKNNDMPIIYM